MVDQMVFRPVQCQGATSLLVTDHAQIMVEGVPGLRDVIHQNLASSPWNLGWTQFALPPTILAAS